MGGVVSAIFGGPKAPAIPPAPVIPPAAPPAGEASVNENLKRKKGDKANLLTGGTGLAAISSENLSSFSLGGGSNLGING